MKKMFLVAALLTVSAGAASAQRGRGPATPEQIHAQQVEAANRWRLYLFNGITLTDSQVSKANDILVKWMQADAALDKTRTPDNPLVASYRNKKTELDNNRNKELAGILSAASDKARFEKNAKTASST